MSWLDLPRLPESEVMDDSGEVEAYASAAAQACLDKIDDTFVEHALRLVRGKVRGRALDIGTGPGQIVCKLAGRLPSWQILGVDRSPSMIREARASLARQGPALAVPSAVEEKAASAAENKGGSVGAQHLSRAESRPAVPATGTSAQSGGRSSSSSIGRKESGAELVPSPPCRAEEAPEGRVGLATGPGGRSFSSDISREDKGALAPEARVQFFIADGNRLPFPDAHFDLVMCNSVLHHLAQPQRLFAEVARLAKPDGAILIRDLRRPSRLAYPLHVRWYGRHYSGVMYKLYCASVRSAYTVAELEAMLRASSLSAACPEPAGAARGARVFRHGRTHLGLERPIG